MTTATAKEEKSKQVIEYDANDAQIAEMSEKFMPLKVNGPEDTEGLKKITKYRIEVKGVRVQIEHQRKSNNEKANKFIKENNTEAKRLTALVAPLEDHLIEQENIVKKEKDRLKAIEQEKLQRIHEDKIKQVVEAGAVFNGYEYVFGDNSVDDTRLRLLDVSAYGNLIERIELWKEKEDLKIAEAAKQKKEEEDRQAKIAEEQAAKEKELKIKEDQQAEREKKLQDQQDKIDEDKRQAAEAKRIQEAEEKAKIEAEKKAVEEKKKHEAEIEAAKKKAVEDEKRHKIEVEEAKKKAAADAKAAAEKKENDRIATEKKEKAAAERKARLAPDKEKLYAFSKALFEVPLPDLKSPESKDFFKPLHTEFVKIITVIREKGKS